ncbi:hypothetical protein BXZ70DRAFT_998118 [Cristinia sonorae]|uniref:Transcription elongation regulator 1 n=1 Tax=Cristinia sonorae TaxID=1940300 RepID=A0A8K0UXA5_9AGAR|nr:hypothetical protein BXZ70DRAFT_998118 [Cristinia sonorae]
MSVPFIPMTVPPLPAGWTEHMGPLGQPYYFNAQTQESTYVRPLPTFANLPPPPVQQQSTSKKEKPRLKTPIPGTDWLRVETTEGNIFYTHKVEKRSVWTVPEEIKDAVAKLEADEAEVTRRREEEERMKEIERVKREVQEAVGKRKAQEPVPVDEVVISKKMRVEEDEDEEGGEDDEDEEDEDSDMEDWQKEAAEQLAKEAEEEKKRQEEEKKREEEEKAKEVKELETQKGRPLNMPDRVDLSLDEAKALFKTLLREKDVNPLHPWDTSLPLFISDPRYVLLPSVTTRREAFDEYCRDRARELRQSQVKKEKSMLTPKEEFERLLVDEVKSTRASWTEWRRQWKKDRRFYSWGRDDREREKRFREYLKELGEKKRAAAQKAEADFFALLKESGVAKAGAVWKEVKKSIVDDPRYDAVGSSSLREELFSTFLKAQETSNLQSLKSEHGEVEVKAGEDRPEQSEADKERERKARKQRAVKEREEKIRAERSKVDAEIDKSRQGLNREENEQEFRTMLVDAIRDPMASWDSVLPQLKTDPRFVNSQLPLNHRLHLFHAHLDQLKGKHTANLYALFLSHAPSLATPFSALPVSSILSSLPATKLGYDVRKLEDLYERWQRERTQEARLAFDEMLNENSFVEFWGRLGKIGGKGVDEGIKADDIGEDSEEIVDMKVLAKTVDLNEMVKVLRNDKRYLTFDHVPEQRERWLRDHLAQLSAPKLSVHVPQGTTS